MSASALQNSWVSVQSNTTGGGGGGISSVVGVAPISVATASGVATVSYTGTSGASVGTYPLVPTFSNPISQPVVAGAVALPPLTAIPGGARLLVLITFTVVAPPGTASGTTVSYSLSAVSAGGTGSSPINFSSTPSTSFVANAGASAQITLLTPFFTVPSNGVQTLTFSVNNTVFSLGTGNGSIFGVSMLPILQSA